TSDARALQRVSAPGRIASCWCDSTITFDINITDGLTHQIAFYGVDWDARGRAARVDVNAFGTNALLDRQSLSLFSNGQYLVWNVSGHVTITFTLTVATEAINAVVSGIFFDPPGGAPASVPGISEVSGNE